MKKIDALEMEKVMLINKIGMKFEKAVMAMDRAAFEVFKAMWKDEVKLDYGQSWTGKNGLGLRCPYYK